MSELYKAMKRIEDYQSTKPLYKQIAEIKGMASTARYGYDIQPQLTIRKSIADELDLINASEYENLIENFFESYNDSTLSERLDEFCIHPFNFNLCILYLVSIELGVDLVKVVEND